MRIGRFVLAALAAGLLLNATGILLAHFVLGDYVRVLIARVGSFPAWAPLAHLAMRFAIAAVALGIWTFVRRRISARWRSVTLTAAFTWILTNPAPLEIWHTVAGLGGADLAMAAAWGFAELWVCIAIGSRLLVPTLSAEAEPRPQGA